MKKVISLVLSVAMTLSIFCIVPFTASVDAEAARFETENGVQVQIAPFLYKSAEYQMEFPSTESYEIKDSSIPGHYAISREINDLSYIFTFPAGTTHIEGLLSLNGESDWRGFKINSEKNPNYWEKDENGDIDYTKAVTFRRNEELAEQDEYGILYRAYLMNNESEGFRDIDTIYWKLVYTCNGETFEEYFNLRLYNYDIAEKHTIKAVNFNVAGLPFEEIKGVDVVNNQKLAGKYFSDNSFDIVAVQEDFGYHNELIGSLTGYNYISNHKGTVPFGDGLSIFTNDMPIYNETRVSWNDASGILSDGSDELTPKGFMYTVIDVGNGIYVDFYNLHADAYGGEGSIKARSSQIRQLAEFIKARSEENDRPVIITGDFNNHMHVHEDDGVLYETLCIEGGFKDAWIEYHNNGDYFNLYKWHISELPAWGNWDSVERFMYRPGGGVDIVVNDFRYVEVTDSNGDPISDHNSAECEFTFIKTEDFVENTEELEVAGPIEINLLQRLMIILETFIKVISDIGNFPELIKEFIGI